MTELDWELDWVIKNDKMDGKRCLSCGKFVKKKKWRLPENDDKSGCKVRPLCYVCA